MSESWMLDELAHAGPEHLDEEFIAGYDRKQGHPDPADDIAELEAHGLGKSAVVVDLGAGTGQFALAAAGFEITDVRYRGQLYGAYTCVKAG